MHPVSVLYKQQTQPYNIMVNNLNLAAHSVPLEALALPVSGPAHEARGLFWFQDIKLVKHLTLSLSLIYFCLMTKYSLSVNGLRNQQRQLLKTTKINGLTVYIYIYIKKGIFYLSLITPMKTEIVSLSSWGLTL